MREDHGAADRRARIHAARDFPENLLPRVLQQFPPDRRRRIPVRAGQREIVVYRSVPRGVGEIRPGDWVTLTREYAKVHGRGKILSKRVPVHEVMWAGTDENEWFWVPRASPHANLGNRERSRGRTRARNPVAATEKALSAYPPESYVGTVVAPKMLVPLAFYVTRGEEFTAFSPDRQLMYGEGYFGDLDRGTDCIRQHMQPGLLTHADMGTGIGTALYVGGNMIVAAAVENLEDFPFRISAPAQRCTYSRGDDRSGEADGAWENMVRHGLAEEDSEEGESETLSERFDADDFIDHDTVEEAMRGRHEFDEITDIDTGWVEVEAVRREQITLNYMFWGTVRESGLILHQGPFFRPSQLRQVFIPPDVFVRIDWDHTTLDQLAMFAQQNREVVESSRGGEAADDWVRETACLFGDTQRGQILLSLIGEEDQQFLPAPARNPRRTCTALFVPEERAWYDRWGPAFTEPNPKHRNRARALQRRLSRR